MFGWTVLSVWLCDNDAGLIDGKFISLQKLLLSGLTPQCPLCTYDVISQLMQICHLFVSMSL